MARNKRQLALRLERIKIANWLLEWLAAKNMREGSKAYQNIIAPFAQQIRVDVFETWKAWDILKEAGRRVAAKGPLWEILGWEPVEADADGKIKAR